MAVLLETSVGDIAIDLYVKEAPKECLNFLKLCKMKFYNFTLVDRVQKNFCFETGRPLFDESGPQSIWGKIDGPSGRFFLRNLKNRIKHKKFGTVSMVNDGNGLHGSQFLITLTENADSLDGKHSVFGEVAEESHDVLRKINDAFCDDANIPYQDIRIRHTIVLDDPFEDPAGLPFPDASPVPRPEQLETGRIRDDEDIDTFKGMSEEEAREAIRKREAKSHTQILEMVGDIPDADVKPPDNVLFVCKLNPVTTDEDLRLIFSRYGKILSCEVIRDRRTNESLQYAFIEFERPEDCEEAYFKMDNVLIDDRRIHVNFSQSVAKDRQWNFQFPAREQAKRGPGGGLAIKDRSGADSGKYALVFDDDHPRDRDDRERSRRRSRSPPRHRDSDRDRDRDRERDKERDRGRDRERERGHSDREKDRDRSRHDDSRRDRDSGRGDRDRERERDRGRDRDRR